jgi:hypothetical protein
MKYMSVSIISRSKRPFYLLLGGVLIAFAAAYLWRRLRARRSPGRYDHDEDWGIDTEAHAEGVE